MKKRLIIAFIVVASVLLFLGASPWEGSAAIAPSGELPATGYYVATNAYPRNTVVDITNLETGKSTRVIVSNTLSNPGLLAVVSRQAGELIGMRTGSISRLRMIQPTDPMAYMRFTQSMKEGNPGYDSGNVITEDKLAEQVYKEDTYKKPEVVKAPEEPKQPLLPGYIVDEPEWGGSGKLQIVDVPDYMYEPERITEVPREVPKNTPEEPGYYNTQRDIAKDVAPKLNERSPVEVTKDPYRSFRDSENPREVVKDVPDYMTESQRKEVVKNTPNYMAETPRKEFVKDAPVYMTENPREVVKDVPSYIAEAPRNEVVKDVPGYLTETPRKVIKDPPSFIAEAPRKEVVKDVPNFITEAPRNEVVKNVSPWQDKVEVVTPGPVTPTPVTPPKQLVPFETSPNPPSPSVYGINPNDIIPGIVVATPEKPVAVVNATPSVNTTPAPDRNLPTIDRLDRGKYYVQVAAMSPDLVEGALRQIDRSYAPVVFKGPDNLYRILIGPLNQGESAAILSRFKSNGYKDAFVRKGG